MLSQLHDRKGFLELPEGLILDLAGLGLVDLMDIWAYLPGGRTNNLWRVTGETGCRVVKLFSPDADTPLFQNDHSAEALVLRELAGQDLAPDLIYCGLSSAGPVLIYRHLSGRSWHEGAERPAAVLRKLHRRPVVRELLDLPYAPRSAAELKAQTEAMLRDIPAQWTSDLYKIEPDDISQPLVGAALLHGDPVPNNFVCNQSSGPVQALLIDWQCPCLGDPVLDLALFLSPAMQVIGRGTPLTAPERALFLRTYDDPAATARLTALQPILHWRMATYCLWKMTRDVPDDSYAAGYEAEISALHSIHL